MSTPQIRAIINQQSAQILADVLDNNQVASRSIIDLLYGIFLARLYESPAAQDTYDIAQLHYYALQRCVDPSRDEEHHHPIRSPMVHMRIKADVMDRRQTSLPFLHLAELTSWLVRIDKILMTPMEFYTTIPPIFLSAPLSKVAIKQAIIDHPYLHNTIIKIGYRSDTTPAYQPKPEVEHDRMRWVAEFGKLAAYLDKQVPRNDTKTWGYIANQHFYVLSLVMALSVLSRSSTFDGLKEALAPHVTNLLVLATSVAYNQPIRTEL